MSVSLQDITGNCMAYLPERRSRIHSYNRYDNIYENLTCGKQASVICYVGY